jgi:hypothetical protein
MPQLPSCRRLQEAFGKTEGLQIRKLLEGREDPRAYESVEAWIRQCYHEPDHDALVMCAINEILEGFGVEALDGGEDAHVNTYYGRHIASYVNMGDTYNVTILLDHTRDNTYYVTSWGDWFELYERRH